MFCSIVKPLSGMVLVTDLPCGGDADKDDDDADVVAHGACDDDDDDDGRLRSWLYFWTVVMAQMTKDMLCTTSMCFSVPYRLRVAVVIVYQTW